MGPGHGRKGEGAARTSPPSGGVVLPPSFSRRYPASIRARTGDGGRP